jgi:hypothetical protein
MAEINKTTFKKAGGKGGVVGEPLVPYIKEVETTVDQLNDIPIVLERHYSEPSTWKMDWNMLLYQPEDNNGFQLDWNKLLYNDEQLEQFKLQKKEKILQPDRYEYLFDNPNERTPMEIFYLREAGYAIDDAVDDAVACEVMESE